MKFLFMFVFFLVGLIYFVCFDIHVFNTSSNTIISLWDKDSDYLINLLIFVDIFVNSVCCCSNGFIIASGDYNSDLIISKKSNTSKQNWKISKVTIVFNELTEMKFIKTLMLNLKLKS